MHRKFWRIAAALALLGVAAPPAQAQAQNWPTRAVKLIVPFGPGAGADIGARLFAEKLQAKWGQPVVVENKPGGDGIVAIQAYLGANDDHVLMFGPSGSFTVHPFMYTKLSYNPAPRPPARRTARSTPDWSKASPSSRSGATRIMKNCRSPRCPTATSTSP